MSSAAPIPRRSAIAQLRSAAEATPDESPWVVLLLPEMLYLILVGLGLLVTGSPGTGLLILAACAAFPLWIARELRAESSRLERIAAFRARRRARARS